MSKIKFFTSGAVFLLMSSLLVLSFQNCTPQKGFESGGSQTNLACSNGTCVESSSEASRTPVSASDSSSSSSSPSSTPSPTPVVDMSQLYNIVSGMSKADCEMAIASNYKKQVACTLGGGCGVSCGKPSSTCQSANPQHYGVCITKDELAAAPPVPSAVNLPPASTMYNFAAGDKASCEQAITGRLGVKSIACRVGGGCGISCGKPNSTCESANPDAFGACVDDQDIAQAKLADVADMAVEQLINVGAGDSATCESTIRSNFGVSISCNVGAGCGVSCGKPSATCKSANPTTYGNCFSKVDIEAVKKAAELPYFNFVAGDKATCESSIKSRLGIRAACTIGGGCGVSCGMPGPLCNSANPSLYGACIPK